MTKKIDCLHWRYRLELVPGPQCSGQCTPVAYHLQARELPVLVASRIVAEDMGRRTLVRIKDLGRLAEDAIELDERHPTLVTVASRYGPTPLIRRPGRHSKIK